MMKIQLSKLNQKTMTQIIIHQVVWLNYHCKFYNFFQIIYFFNNFKN